MRQAIEWAARWCARPATALQTSSASLEGGEISDPFSVTPSTLLRWASLRSPTIDALPVGHRVQCGARRHGKAGIYGDPGNMESATYRNQNIWQSSNPTLSANLQLIQG